MILSKSNLFFAFTSLSLSSFSFAVNEHPQTNFCESLDNKLTSYLQVIQKRTPSQDNALKKFETLLKSFVKHTPAKQSMQCNFPISQNNGLYLRSSVDKKFRAYTWDTNTGGTLHEYDGFVQFISAKGKPYIAKELMLSRADNIATMNINGKATYFLVEGSIGSGRMHAKTLTLYQINGSKLVKPKLIQTKTRKTSYINFMYEPMSIEKNGLSYHLIRINPKKKQFQFPIIIENDNYTYGEVTKRNIRYVFKNGLFHRVH